MSTNSPPATPPPSRRSDYWWLAACVGLTAGLLGWQWLIGSRNAALATALRVLEFGWTTRSAQLAEAEETQQKIEDSLRRTKRVIEMRSERGWGAALQGVVAALGPEIELQQIRAQAKPDSAASCEIEIVGAASGRTARALAERFRATLETNLVEHADPQPVSVRFEHLVDEPGRNPGEMKATFTIKATIGALGQRLPQYAGTH